MHPIDVKLHEIHVIYPFVIGYFLFDPVCPFGIVTFSKIICRFQCFEDIVDQYVPIVDKLWQLSSPQQTYSPSMGTHWLYLRARHYYVSGLQGSMMNAMFIVDSLIQLKCGLWTGFYLNVFRISYFISESFSKSFR